MTLTFGSAGTLHRICGARLHRRGRLKLSRASALVAGSVDPAALTSFCIILS